MQTYHFKEIVNKEGAVTLSGLPPFTQVAVVVIQPDLSEWHERMRKLMHNVSENHPYAKMSQEDILRHLRQSRQEVYSELYGDRHAD